MTQPIATPRIVKDLVDLLKANGFYAWEDSHHLEDPHGSGALRFDLPDGRTIMVSTALGVGVPASDEDGVYACLFAGDEEPVEETEGLDDEVDTPVTKQIQQVLDSVRFWGVLLKPVKP